MSPLRLLSAGRRWHGQHVAFDLADDSLGHAAEQRPSESRIAARADDEQMWSRSLDYLLDRDERRSFLEHEVVCGIAQADRVQKGLQLAGRLLHPVLRV